MFGKFDKLAGQVMKVPEKEIVRTVERAVRKVHRALVRVTLEHN